MDVNSELEIMDKLPPGKCKCKICGTITGTTTLFRHILTVHNVSRYNYEEIDRIPSDHKCSECGKHLREDEYYSTDLQGRCTDCHLSDYIAPSVSPRNPELCKYLVTSTRIKCKYCGEIVSCRRLEHHLLTKHNISKESYINDVLQLSESPRCKNSNCNNPVKIHSVTRGYLDYCSQNCAFTEERKADISEVISRKFIEDSEFRERHSLRSSKSMRKLNEKRDRKNNDWIKYLYFISNGNICKIGICSEHNYSRVEKMLDKIPNSKLEFLQIMDLDSANYIESSILDFYSDRLLNLYELESIGLSSLCGSREILKFSDSILEDIHSRIIEIESEYW